MYMIRMTEGRNDFKILTVKPIGMRSVGISRRGWESNIRMDLKEKLGLI